MILKFACEKESGYTLPFNFLAAKSTELYNVERVLEIEKRSCCARILGDYIIKF